MGFDFREEEAVLRVMRSGILSGYQGNWSENFYGGPEVKALEKEWAEYFGVKHAIACNSATSGLWMALNCIGLELQEDMDNRQDEVIVSPYTMTCSASLPLLFNAKPVFADIELDYFCIDPVDIERKITRNTKAIIAVDIFGQPADFDKINEIAERKGREYGHKIYVIEDAAQAPGAKYKGKYTGTLGDIGVYSLNRHKHVHCGEGGIVVTDNNELALKLRLSMNHAEAVINDFEIKEHKPWKANRDCAGTRAMVGMNLRMTELSAAIARVQLTKLEEILKVYREDAKYFPVKVREGCESSWYRYAWTKETTNEFMECNNDWEMKRGYITPIFQMPLFKQLGYDQNQCPVVQEVNENITLAWHKEPI